MSSIPSNFAQFASAVGSPQCSDPTALTMNLDTSPNQCATLASNPMTSNSGDGASATAYGLRRRSRLGHLSCGQVYDCASRIPDPLTLSSVGKDASPNDWASSRTSSAFQASFFSRAEADTGRSLPVQSPNRIDALTRRATTGAAKKRSSRRGLSTLPAKVRNGSMQQPYHNKFSEEINKDLYNWLNDHLEFPYPTDEQKVELCQRTGLTKLQLRYWFTNVRRRTLPSIIQSRNEDRMKKGLSPIKSRSRWESDPRQAGKENGRHLRLSEQAPVQQPVYMQPGEAGFGAEKMKNLWSYSMQPMSSVSSGSTTEKVNSPTTPMAYCPVAPPQPMWHTASIAVAHVRNALYTGIPYDGMQNGGYNSTVSQATSPSQTLTHPAKPSHLSQIVLTPASPHPQLSFQAHASGLYSPMELLPTMSPAMTYPSASPSMASSANAFTTSAVSQ